LFIKVPEWLRDEHPEMIENLRNNQYALTTPFDLYATMQHVTYFPKIPNLLPFQKSLFLPISPDRDCSEAKIPNHWCSCRKRKNGEINETVKKGAGLLVGEINSRLNEHGEGRCAVVYLDKILNVEIFEYSKEMVAFNVSEDPDGRIPKFGKMEEVTEYQIQFRVTPGGGVLEGDFVFVDGNIEVGSHFSRINAYGDLPCNPKPLVREFCVCINKVALLNENIW